jgi:uncharacterized membrane protein
MRSKAVVLTIAALAFIGFADATFLTVEHFRGGAVPCFITTGCDTVTTSSYSLVLGIPVALLGALFYLAVIVLALMDLDFKPRWLGRALFILSTIAFIESLYFLYLQAFVIHAFCIYCLISLGVATLIFLCTAGGKFYRLQ